MEPLVWAAVLISVLIAGRSVLGSEDKARPNDAVAAPAEVARIHDYVLKNCTDCHNQKKKKGDIRLDHLNTLSNNELLDIVGKIEKQISLNQMPPDEGPLPIHEKQAVLAWIDKIYAANGLKSGFKDEFRRYKYGNYANHDQLFSGEFKNLPGYTEDRQWLISEYIFTEKMNALMGAGRAEQIGGRSVEVHGRPIHEKITNPFLLPTAAGVRYYANEELNSGQFQTMLSNSEVVADAMIGIFAIKNKEYLPAAKKITEMTLAHNATIESRRAFMMENIERICSDIYKEADESMLPAYTAVALPDEVNEKAEAFGKWGWRNRIGAADGDDINKALDKFKTSGAPKKDIIAACARYWCHYGEDAATIQRRIGILVKELSSILSHGHSKSRPAYVYKPLDNAEMKAIEAAIKANREKGMPYKILLEKCVAQWREEFQQLRAKNDVISDELVADLVTQLTEKIYKRQPAPDERREQTALMRSYMGKLGPDEAVRKLTQTLLLGTEFIYRNEYGEGRADQHGRRMLSPKNAAIALAYALTDDGPDEQLLKAADQGMLNTRDDYRREVTRMLQDKSRYCFIDPLLMNKEVSNITNTPIRKLRFFREFFGYPNMLSIFKDEKRFDADFGLSQKFLVAEADMLVDFILKKDKRVFEELLTTDKFYVYHNGDNGSMLSAAEKLRKPYEYFKDKNWQSFKSFDDLVKHQAFLSSTYMQGVDIKAKTAEEKKKAFENFKEFMSEVSPRFSGGSEYAMPVDLVRFAKQVAFGQRGGVMSGGANVAYYFNLNPNTWNYPASQPAKIDNRKGMLTHPAWLIAHAQNFETDPVRRGKWVREKLLAGTVPDVPITVEAVIPEDHTRTLRQRLASATQSNDCWKCHVYMNPLGNAFEIFDDFGRFRMQEQLEHPDNIVNPENERKIIGTKAGKGLRLRYKTLPVDAKSVLNGTGDAKLDGDVSDALDLIDRLAKSTRVRQSIIRNAFRYFLGRNETLSDSKALIDADNAYVESGGSFDAVIISLLTSDSFIYRKKVQDDLRMAAAGDGSKN